MSAFKGRQGKGARQRHRDDKYLAAVGRQLLNLDRGSLQSAVSPLTGMHLHVRSTPAPIGKFLRKGDTADSYDFRSWAVSK